MHRGKLHNEKWYPLAFTSVAMASVWVGHVTTHTSHPLHFSFVYNYCTFYLSHLVFIISMINI